MKSIKLITKPENRMKTKTINFPNSLPSASTLDYQLENRGKNNGKLQTVGLDRLFGNGYQSFLDKISTGFSYYIFPLNTA